MLAIFFNKEAKNHNLLQLETQNLQNISYYYERPFVKTTVKISIFSNVKACILAILFYYL